jgi:hypothetical protein
VLVDRHRADELHVVAASPDFARLPRRADHALLWLLRLILRLSRTAGQWCARWGGSPFPGEAVA